MSETVTDPHISGHFGEDDGLFLSNELGKHICLVLEDVIVFFLFEISMIMGLMAI